MYFLPWRLTPTAARVVRRHHVLAINVAGVRCDASFAVANFSEYRTIQLLDHQRRCEDWLLTPGGKCRCRGGSWAFA
jgi:hypothetical protein